MSLVHRRPVLGFLGFLGLAAFSSMGCTITAEIPQIQARELRFTGVDAAGLTFQVDFNAFNTNTFTLDLHDLRARMFLDGNDVGAGVSAVSAQIPPGRWTPVTATMTIPWNGVPGSLLMAAGGGGQVNYVLQGEVTVDHYVSIRAPFETRGAVPRDFFMRGATGTINNVINSVLPGFGNIQ